MTYSIKERVENCNENRKVTKNVMSCDDGKKQRSYAGVVKSSGRTDKNTV
eukprot:CAMPEP_0195513000 /NCGR_PEP_ID=MMETSP0794_2-20130614/4765_1 /TAXON_ID=515487 /ORGANISM="Stephanopyxis turris, Strain CCMP 815" /LENGTH=49 /DNA_ID=CAMNT_0040640903 /DNA_START=255 /DNA_END=404 /DNA_ORIENTATION=+